MATFLQIRPCLLSTPLHDITRLPNHSLLPHQRRFRYGGGGGGGGDLISIRRNQFHGGGGGGGDKVGVVKFGFFDSGGGDADGIREVFGRLESVFYTIADAAVASSDKNGDWLSGITGYMETVLKVLKGGLSGLHVPYSYGFAIILLTVLVKAATFPLTKKQVESAMAMKSLQPQVKAIQQQYAGNQEKIQLETARLYKLASINPLAGCLPTLATIPIWIGLYRALSNVADEGLLTEGFFWIPSLAGPTTIAARQSGGGISWLFPFIDGQPPLGWHDTLAYLVLPVLLVVSQYVSVQIMQSSQSNDPSMKSSQAITQFLPLLIGYFSLSVPSGLSLYWLTNNILSTTQQVYLQKLGGAANPVTKLNGEIFKVEPPEVEKPTFEVTSVKEAPKQKEKLTSEGPRPGERFRLLKEQEARKKQEREEQKRKSIEATTSGSEITNGAKLDYTDEDNASLDSVTNGTIVNSNRNGQAIESDMSKVNGKVEQPSFEEQEKGNN